MATSMVLDPSSTFPLSQYFPQSASGPNANALRPFFGEVPNMPSQGPGRDYYHRIEDLPTAYADARQNLYLETVINGLVPLDNDWTTTIACPLTLTDKIHFTWNEIRFNKPVADAVPHEGTTRMVKHLRATKSASSVRRGLALEVETDFMTTQMGIDTYIMTLQQIRLAIQRTNSLDVMAAIMDAHIEREVWERVHGWRQLDPRERLDQEIDQFGCVQQDPKGLIKWDAHARALAKSMGWDPDMYIVPSGFRAYVTIVPTTTTWYMFAGPRGVEKMLEGPRGMGQIQGINVYETPMSDVMSESGDFVNMMDRICYTGEYYTMVDKAAADTSTFTTNDERTIKIYSEDSDSIEPISFMQTFDHCSRFQQNGELDYAHTTLAYNAGHGGEDANDIVDMFIYRDNTGVAKVCTYAGQMETPALPFYMIENTANSAFRGSGLNQEEMNIIDSKLKEINDSMGRDQPDLSYHVMAIGVGATPAKLGDKFKPAFSKLYSSLKNRFTIRCGVLSPHRPVFPTQDAGTSDDEKGQAALFYSLLNFRLCLLNTGDNTAFSIPSFSPDAYQYIIDAYLEQLDKVTKGQATGDVAHAKENMELVKAIKGKIASSGEPNVDVKQAKYLVMATIHYVDNEPNKNKVWSALNKIESNQPALWANLLVEAANELKTNIIQPAIKVQVASEFRSFGQDPPTLTLVSLAWLVKEEIDNNKQVLVLSPQGGFTSMTVANTKINLDGTTRNHEQQVLDKMFDYSHVYGAHKADNVPSNTLRHGTSHILGFVDTAGGKAKRNTAQLVSDLLGTEPRNKEEMETLGKCPPLLFNIAKACEEESAVKRACLLSTIMTRIIKQSLEQMVKSNTYCWWGHLICKPWDSHIMSTIVLMRGGPSTGVTYWGHAKMEMGQDPRLGILAAYVRYYSRAIILNPDQIILGENMFYRRYLGGGGIKWFTETDLTKMLDINFKPAHRRKNAPALVSFMIPGCETEFDKYGDIRGYHTGAVEQNDRWYSSAQYYCIKHRFDGLSSGELGYLHFNREPYPNSLVIQGMQFSRSRGSKEWDQYQPNLGHHGPRVGPGTARVRNGQDHELPISYTNSASILGQVNGV